MFRIKVSEIPAGENKNKLEFLGSPADEFSERFDAFASAYSIKDVLFDDPSFKRPLTPKADRTCRFCKVKFSHKEKFKSLAHLISELIGNKNLFSDFECDSCNNLFSKYENSLANFLGVARATHIENAKSGKYKFKSPDKALVVMKDEEVEDKSIPKLRVESHADERDGFTVDAENKKVTFHTVRHSYIPFHVYKVFLKIGLSIIPPEYVDDYDVAIALLLSKKKYEMPDNPFFKLNMYVHPGPAFPSPAVILFEKNDKTAPMPTHIVCIMFHNYTYQLTLPLYRQDKWMYDGKTIVTVPHMPPFIDKHFAKHYGLPKGHVLNFNLDELKKNEKNDITFSFEGFTDTRKSEANNFSI